MSEPFNATPKAIIQHFTPAWFASVMGTAVIPLALSFIDAFWVRPVSIAFLVLSILLFLVFLSTFDGQVLPVWGILSSPSKLPSFIKCSSNSPITKEVNVLFDRHFGDT